MLVDIIIDKETVLTISLKSVAFLLKATDKTQFPIRMDERELIIQFRKEVGE